MRAADLLAIVAIAGGCAVAVGFLGAALLHLLRRTSILAQITLVAVLGISATTAGTVGVAKAMFLSNHDLTVQLYVTAIAGLAAIGLSLVLGHHVIRASRDLTSATRKLGNGAPPDLDDAPRSAELSALAHELHTTSAKLAESREREHAIENSRRELIAWISHDLRTPLAGLRAMAEALEDGIANEPQLYHQRIRCQVDRMTHLVDDLFELSRIQSGALILTLTDVSLYDLISDTIADIAPAARARDILVHGDQVPHIDLHADSRKLTRALANLLHNAVQYTPPNGSITVAASTHASGATTISVADTCGGIPEPELSRVFDTGWRGSNSRSPPRHRPSRPRAGHRQRHRGSTQRHRQPHQHSGRLPLRPEAAATEALTVRQKLRPTPRRSTGASEELVTGDHRGPPLPQLLWLLNRLRSSSRSRSIPELFHRWWSQCLL